MAGTCKLQPTEVEHRADRRGPALKGPRQSKLTHVTRGQARATVASHARSHLHSMPTDDATVDEFLAITGVTREEALPLLDSAGGDLATAVELFFAQQDSGAQNAQDAAVAAQVAADEYG